MKGKAILAKLLAVAVTMTSILPGSLLQANAAPVIFEETTHQWMYTDEENKFQMNPERWIDAKSATAQTPFENFGRTLYVGEGLPTWRLTSLVTDGNNNNGSYANADAPACVYANNIDISASADSRRVMRFVLYPPKGSVVNWGIRFGIMLKYIDATHWTFLGFNGDWYMQWMNGTDNKGWVDKDTTSYEKPDGTNGNWGNVAFKNVKPQDETFTRITVIYEDKDSIRIRVAQCEGTVDEDGNTILEEKTGDNQVAEDTLDFKVFGDLRDYADVGQQQIHLGFVAGTDGNQLNPDSDGNVKGITKMDIVNVMKGALYPSDTEGKTDEDYKEELQLLSYADCGWTSPKESADPEKILAPSRTSKGYTYATIGKKAEHAGNKDFAATIYNNQVENFGEGSGSVSGVLRPYTVGSGKECSIGVLGEGEDAKSFKIGIKDEKWFYEWGGTETVLSGTDLPAIEGKRDYKISMAIDTNHKLTAEVTALTPASPQTPQTPTSPQDSESSQSSAGSENAALISADKPLDVTGLSGRIALETKGEILRVRDIFCHKIGYDRTPLELKYNELIKKNDKYTFYNDAWETFAVTSGSPLQIAKATLDSSDEQFSDPQVTAFAPFNKEAAQALQSSFDAFNVDANKVAAGKESLQTEYNKIKDLNLDDAEYNDYYTTESIAALKKARQAVADLLASINKPAFKGINKSEIEDAKSSINKDTVLVKIEMAKTEAVAELDRALEGVAEYTKYDNTAGNRYYNNWNDFAAAVQAINTLKEASVIYKIDVKNAKDALNNAVDGLTQKKVTSVSDFQNQIKAFVISAEDLDKYYEKKADAEDGALNTYKAALSAANQITTDSTVIAADEAKAALEAAFNNLQLKKAQDSDKANATAQINEIVSQVSAKKYKDDDNWKEYQRLLKEAQDLAASEDVTLFDLDAAIAALKEAQGALVEETGEDKPPVTDNDNNKKPPVQVQGPKKGETKTVGAATYTIEDPAAATVILTAGDKKSKKIKIDTVTIDNKRYTVVGIGANAFKGGKMKSVTIGSGITSIGKNAFSGCKSMTSVTIGKDVQKIEGGAFSKCSKLKTVSFKGAPKTIAKNSFKGTKVKTVKVPKKVKKDKKFLQKVKKAGMKVSKLK